MRKNRIYLSPPHLGNQEKELVIEAIQSNWVAPLGPHVDAFEREVCEYTGAKFALALSSGTAALHLALRVMGIRTHDIVFCSSLTFVASANPILYEGGVPVFIDSDRDSWNLSPQALERALESYKKKNSLPKALMLVNLYGQSSDMAPIQELCSAYGVPIIEDAAESLGATYQGRASGTFGKMAAFSFNGNKIITTSGGGMLVSDDAELIQKARFLSTQAKEPARHYEHQLMGYNYRMSNLLAAVGRGQLQILDQRITERRAVFARYNELLSDLPGVRFMPEASFGRSTRWLSVLWLDPKGSPVKRDEILDLLDANNIEARPVWKPLHRQPLFEGADYFSASEAESVSDFYFQNGLCLPSGSSLTESEQMEVISLVRSLWEKR